MYIPLLLSVIAWIIFFWSWSDIYYRGYEKGLNDGIDATLERINELSFDDGFKYEIKG